MIRFAPAATALATILAAASPSHAQGSLLDSLVGAIEIPDELRHRCLQGGIAEDSEILRACAEAFLRGEDGIAAAQDASGDGAVEAETTVEGAPSTEEEVVESVEPAPAGEAGSAEADAAEVAAPAQDATPPADEEVGVDPRGSRPPRRRKRPRAMTARRPCRRRTRKRR